MKITPEWLASTDHCPDGLAFGLAMVPPRGLELSQCWPLIERPDWVVSLAVKTGTIPYSGARLIVEEALYAHASDIDCQDMFAVFVALRGMRWGTVPMQNFRAEVAALAYEAVAVKKKIGLAHRLNCLGQIISADLAPKGCDDVALTRLQGAAFSLGLSMGQSQASAKIKALVFGSKKHSDSSRPVR